MNRILHSLYRSAFLSLLAVSALSAFAGNTIEKVEFSQLSDKVLVKISMREALSAVPSSFSVVAPPRIAFDFPDTDNATGSGVINAGVGALKGINIVQAGPRTRLVINLANPSQYEPRVEGNVLFISLGSSAAKAPTQTSAAVAPVSQSPNSAQTSISNVDFQASGTDLATVKIDLSDTNVSLDVQKQGNNGLALVFPGTAVPARLERKLDVRDFGSPISTVSTMKLGKGSQILLSNRGEWDYSVRQIDASVVVEVRRVQTDPNSVTGAKELQGKVISFNFAQPIPVSQMIGIFQDITGLNFVVMPGVAGEIQSLKMDNTPVNVAIDVISRMYGLGFRRYGGIVVVGKADDLAKYDKDERERAAALEKLEPIEQDSFKVRYRSAAEIVQALTGASSGAAAGGAPAAGANPSATPGAPASPTAGSNQQGQLSGASKSMISDRGTVSFDSVTNTIFVEETRGQLEKIRQRVQVLDRPIKQVMIEARIVSVKDSFSKSLGAKLSFLRSNNNAPISGSIDLLSSKLPSGTAVTRGTGQQMRVSGGYNAAAGGTDLAFSLFNSNQTRLLNLELAADESDGKSKSIATPKVITQDGRQATITSGQNICFQLSTTTTTTTQCIDAATKLDVTPQINPDGRIQMKVYVNKGKPSTNAGTVAVVSTEKNEITTNVVVENGGTLMLGGLFTDDSSNNVDRIPFLGDLPYVGFLFKQTTQTRDKNELLVFITPRIVGEDLNLLQ
ncbi:MAG: type IV pilus secretin PilQ [Rhodocyclaceae bacterium]|jgi:type IV pilus assembly protein PilQ|nr:type IV pilus secretin PilQ [Rhodocyclaceae bacterium]